MSSREVQCASDGGERSIALLYVPVPATSNGTIWQGPGLFPRFSEVHWLKSPSSKPNREGDSAGADASGLGLGLSGGGFDTRGSRRLKRFRHRLLDARRFADRAMQEPNDVRALRCTCNESSAAARPSLAGSTPIANLFDPA